MDTVPSSFVSSMKATYERGGAIPKSLTSGTISPSSPSFRLSKQDGNASWLSGEYAPNNSGTNMQHVDANGSYYAPPYSRQSAIVQPQTTSSARGQRGDRITRFASRSNYSGVETPRSLLDKRSAASRSSSSTAYASSTLPLMRHTSPSVGTSPASRASAMDSQSGTLRTPSRASAALNTAASATQSDAHCVVNEQPQMDKTASLHMSLQEQPLTEPLNGNAQAQAQVPEVTVADRPELVTKKHVTQVSQQRPNMAAHQLPPSAVLAVTSSSLPNTPERTAAPQNKMLVREVAPVRTRAFQFSYAPHSASLEFVAVDRATPVRERSVDVPSEQPPASPLTPTPDSAVNKPPRGGVEDAADGDDSLSTNSVHSDAQPDSREQSLRHRGNLTSRLFASLRISKKSRKAKPHTERTLDISSPLSDTLVSSRGGALPSQHAGRPNSDPSANSSVKPAVVPAALVQAQVCEPLVERGVRPTKLELSAPPVSSAVPPPLVVTPPVVAPLHEPTVLLRENAYERNELDRFSTPVSMSSSDASPQLQVDRRERAYVSTALSAFGYTSLRRTPLQSDSQSLSQTDSPDRDASTPDTQAAASASEHRDEPPVEFQPPQVDEKAAADSNRPEAQLPTDNAYAETADSGLSVSTSELAAEAPTTTTDEFPLDPSEQHAAGDVN